MARKRFKSTLKSSSSKLPKSRITKEPEEKPRKIREKKIDLDFKRTRTKIDIRDVYSEEQLKIIRAKAAKKAASTRKEKESKLSAQEREALRKKRAEQARKNFSKATIDKEKRKAAAKKAAETRKRKEAAMTDEEREALRKKRAEQARKNFSKKSTKEKAKQRKQFSEHEPYSDYEYASWTDEALSKIEEFLESFSFEEKYLGKNPSNVWESTYQRKAEFVAKIRAILDYRISQEGRDVVAKQIYDSGIDVDTAINGIKRASTPEDVTYYAGEIIAAILDRPMTREEGEIYNDIAEANSTYDMGDDEGEY